MAKILIIDDQAENRQYLVKLLGYRGHRVLEASDGVEGLQTARAEKPDLILSDILMPTMDGFGFVQRLREDPAISRTSVIFFTAHYQASQVEDLARDCGVRQVLVKPVSPKVVLRVVEEALGLSPAADPPAAPDPPQEGPAPPIPSQLKQKLDDLGARLAAIIEHTLELSTERDPQHLLESTCRALREVVGARIAVVGLLEDQPPTDGGLIVQGADAAVARRLLASVFRQQDLATLFAQRRCCRLANLQVPPLLAPGQAPKPLPISCFLGVPITSPGQVYGWICLLGKLGEEAFNEEDERLASILAAQVGRTYESVRLYEEVQQQARALEREMAERKQAEEALGRSESRFRALIENSHDVITLNAPDGTILYASPSIYRVFGYRAEELIGTNAWPLVHPKDQDKLRARLGDALQSAGTPLVNEHRIRHKDGSWRWVEATGTNLFADPGVGALVCNLRDISERKQLEEQYRQAQQHLHRVLSSSPAILFTLTIAAGQIQGLSWISDNLQQLLGHRPESALGPGWWLENIHPADRDRVLSQTQAELFTQGQTSSEYRFRDGNGSYRWTRGELRLIRDAAGQPVEVVGSWSDITAHKQLEDQFRQAQKMEAVGRLAGGVAHDFNNLLTIINGYGEILLPGLATGDPARTMVQEIVAAGDRAAGLTRQLLAFSRKAILEPRILDLKEVVANLEKMLRRIIGEDILLTVTADPGLDTVKADPGQVEQVLLNLVVNARDAMPNGGRLTIEVRNTDLDETYARDHLDVQPGPYVLLAVSDTGCGMDQATLSRIFEPFFTTKGEKGTGLGLATVHGIIKQSGGHIAVTSELGHGTTFKVYLPGLQQRPTEGQTHPGRTEMPRGSERVLLVEDEDGVRALIRFILEGGGYSILEARDGAEALRAAQQHQGPIDLLVTDVVMPQMDGRQVAERVRALHPGLRVLFLSGYTEDTVVRHGILEAQVAFLQKPFTPASLAAKVREVLDSR